MPCNLQVFFNSHVILIIFWASLGMLSVLGGRGSWKIISVLLQNKRKAIVHKNLSILEGAVVGALVFMYRLDNDDLATGE